MRSLWRRLMAWWNADDITAEVLAESMAREIRDAEDRVRSQYMEGYIQVLRNIGASPRAIRIAEQVLAEMRAKELNA